MAAFDSVQAFQGLAGGILIGLAAAIMLLGAGRVAGVSGITARAIGLNRSGIEPAGAWSFLLALPAGGAIAVAILDLPPARFHSWPTLIAAGLLVGFGAQLASGCTSGHGVCGVSRLSQRSILATATFMAAGVMTVLVARLAGAQ